MSKKYYWKCDCQKSLETRTSLHHRTDVAITFSDLKENREIKCPYCNRPIPEEKKREANTYLVYGKL